ncbi:MAG TPA: hypothetical protein PLR26_06030 [Bacilli bacterium]|nr:hypothetical protein [Bacilli bacterium]
MTPDMILEWIGYLASTIVLISLLMSSIKKLRWINLIGSSIFATYGFLIGSFPVGFMNVGIALINIYYLYRMYTSKDFFQFLPIDTKSQYLNYFLDFHRKNIERFMNLPFEDIHKADISLFVLRNMQPAGVFVCSKYDEKTLKVEIDYVVKEYQDFKIGCFVFDKQQAFFQEKGFNRFISFTKNEKHIYYLRRMGFAHEPLIHQDAYVKRI